MSGINNKYINYRNKISASVPNMCLYKNFEFFLQVCILVKYVWKTATNLSFLAQLSKKTAQVGSAHFGGNHSAPRGQWEMGSG